MTRWISRTPLALSLVALSVVDAAAQSGGTLQPVQSTLTQLVQALTGPIATAPFYAVKLYPGDIGAANGLVTNEQAEVVDRDNQPIRHLYACGNDMQSIMGGTYPGPGITIGPAITFAYRAIRHALHGETS